MNYRFAYAVGFHPSEDLVEHPPFANKLLELVAREEDGREAPYGPALDIGTGSAVWGVKLSDRAWQFIGIDIVESALRRARQRVDETGVPLPRRAARTRPLGRPWIMRGGDAGSGAGGQPRAESTMPTAPAAGAWPAGAAAVPAGCPAAPPLRE